MNKETNDIAINAPYNQLIKEADDSKARLSAVCRALNITGTEAKSLSPDHLYFMVRGMVEDWSKNEQGPTI